MTKVSDHFSLEEWADYGRGRMAQEQSGRMERHLAQGCESCSQALKLWKGVLQAASREDAFEPPKHILRCARSLYGAFPLAIKSSLRLRVAQLAGFNQPAPVGVRASGAGPVGSHFLFREGSLLLDMRMQPKPASDAVSVIGQVLDSSKQDARFGNRAVSLVRESDALARTTTNEFGEFQLEFTPAEDLLVIIELEDESYLVSHLPAPKR
ncbi:MAG TPA: hypothetical protein VKB88_33355 [Bryobacteraceae bacterium]|nr:hypothetical protein [Bryobacteraceae bacterium]